MIGCKGKHYDKISIIFASSESSISKKWRSFRTKNQSEGFCFGASWSETLHFGASLSIISRQPFRLRSSHCPDTTSEHIQHQLLLATVGFSSGSAAQAIINEVSLLLKKREEEDELLTVNICRVKVRRQRGLTMNKLTFFFEAEVQYTQYVMYQAYRGSKGH
jgi:hypothetical protein